ncbi:RNA polymerase sigma factor, sigma-70 family [Streptomyces sp. yr375]|uniref:sigma factor n=1 Tax=Streptomyces sp. yr375 TaxID=1761906 RepID=UPI0008BE5532|nr:sigma factor [Streptomyces sp. yr375]SEP93203.1 RNA polymerase sigma factor, sigma-70 family [Streptomyces sp. yr375]
MTDRSTAVPAPSAQCAATAAYARVYEEQQPRLVAYARSLTRNAWTAEDLVAEAHFRVWRRLSEGHEIDNVPAYLKTTVRHLAMASGSAARETPRDPQTEDRAEPGGHGADPAEQVSSVDLVVRVLGQLPERWVKALWLAEAEGQPLAAIGPQLGTKDGATAVLLHRAREGMRQAFLRAQTGAPQDPACQVHWARMPAYVRGAATARQSERLLGHVDACDDCRALLASLMQANDRLPALVGPALLVLAVGGTGKFLLAFAAGTTGAATTAAAAAGAGWHGAGLLHGVRQAAVGGAKAPAAVTAGTLVAGAAVVVLVLGWSDSAPIPAQRVPVAGAPAAQVPLSEAPVAKTAEAPPSPAAVPAVAPMDDGMSPRTTDARPTAPRPDATPTLPSPSASPGASESAQPQPAPVDSPTATPGGTPSEEPPYGDGTSETPDPSPSATPAPAPSPSSVTPQTDGNSAPDPTGTGTGGTDCGTGQGSTSSHHHGHHHGREAKVDPIGTGQTED